MSEGLGIELLAPAGGPEQLRAAIHFGADAVYLSGSRWNMRMRCDGFDTDDDLAQAVALAHANDVRVHIALNTLMADADIDALPSYLRFLQDIGADALIVADLGAMALARKHVPNLQIHISTQASCMNAASALEYARLGATRIVLAREMSLAQIHELKRRIPQELELEVFAHGAMCMAVSGRCLMSSQLVGAHRGASFGQCTQPCRWSYTLTEKTRPNMPMQLVVDEADGASYILSSDDLCMIEHLNELAEAGVGAIKLEGRSKGAYYVATVVNAYRHVLDGEPAADWLREVNSVSHRPYSTGFFFGNPTQNPGDVDYIRERRLVAVVEAVEGAPGDVPGDAVEGESGTVGTSAASCVVTVVCRNKAALGAELEVLSPGKSVRSFSFSGVEHYDSELMLWARASEMREAMGRYRLTIPFEVAVGDMLCCRE